ncbi:hypothetical protein CEXT_217791 [Caerostris extrusa]|uniref:Uncharacterized protein n=1 Tax=Caerostris extrusa TaxID=172846 RepID=A0AAV4RBX4_CAEEX|nr:hypothetical protein CEXT_217791 [Caerostris extrusa]
MASCPLLAQGLDADMQRNLRVLPQLSVLHILSYIAIVADTPLSKPRHTIHAWWKRTSLLTIYAITVAHHLGQYFSPCLSRRILFCKKTS